MKKIIVVSSVKNECDIIESFCRYNLSFCDCMLIHENHKSSDNTRHIINRLIEEGLPIYFEAEEDMHFATANNVLAETAVDKYGADIIIQLDADEFLYHKDGINPREVLESLNDDVEYQVPWRTYVYENEHQTGDGFIPAAFSHYRNPALEEAQGHAGKVIASRYLLTAAGAQLGYGTHWLDYPDGQKATAKIEITDTLVCAHYPIRNPMQVMNKTIINWINKWTLPEPQRPRSEDLTVHQLGMLFDAIKEHGSVPGDKMRELSITYSLYNISDKDKVDALLRDLGDKLLIEGAIDSTFCAGKLNMCYGSCSENITLHLPAILSILEEALQNLDSESRTKSHAFYQRDVMKQQIENIYASNTWKTGYRIVSFLRFFVPGKRKNPGKIYDPDEIIL